MISEVKQMYQLYINDKTFELKISRLSKSFTRYPKLIEYLKNTPDDIYYYNDNYRFCGKRLPLVELGKAIKNGWLVQAKNAVQIIEEIKI
jgi:hypothetical protein